MLFMSSCLVASLLRVWYDIAVYTFCPYYCYFMQIVMSGVIVKELDPKSPFMAEFDVRILWCEVLVFFFFDLLTDRREGKKAIEFLTERPAAQQDFVS
jgi:hypothetical protein